MSNRKRDIETYNNQEQEIYLEPKQPDKHITKPQLKRQDASYVEPILVSQKTRIGAKLH